MTFTPAQAARGLAIQERLRSLEKRVPGKCGTQIWMAADIMPNSGYHWSPSEATKAAITALHRAEIETERAALVAEAKELGFDLAAGEVA